MAEIFNNFDRQTETRFMTALEDENRESAERIKTLAAEIKAVYGDREFTMISLINGAVISLDVVDPDALPD